MHEVREDVETTREHATRTRLVAAAATLFADRGFQDVTVREICRAASANVAAVNYHFGDKLGLYRAVVQAAIRVMKDTNEAAIEAGRGAAPEAQLRAHIRVFLTRLAGRDRASWVHKLMAREMEEPTDALELVVRDALEPRIAHLGGIVAALTGLPGEDSRVLRAVMSIQAQCLIFGRAAGARLTPSWDAVSRDLEAVAAHIADFSLAGTRNLAGRGPRTSRSRTNPRRPATRVRSSGRRR